MPPVSPSDSVSSLKPRNVLLRGGSIRRPDMANHLGFSIPSSPSSSKQNVQRYLTSFQLVFVIGCRGIPAVLDNYLGKALAIQLGRRVADL